MAFILKTCLLPKDDIPNLETSNSIKVKYGIIRKEKNPLTSYVG